jgi:hypothetical protein
MLVQKTARETLLSFQKYQPTAAKILEKDAISDEMHQFLGTNVHVHKYYSTNPHTFTPTIICTNAFKHAQIQFLHLNDNSI